MQLISIFLIISSPFCNIGSNISLFYYSNLKSFFFSLGKRLSILLFFSKGPAFDFIDLSNVCACGFCYLDTDISNDLMTGFFIRKRCLFIPQCRRCKRWGLSCCIRTWRMYNVGNMCETGSQRDSRIRPTIYTILLSRKVSRVPQE